MMRWMIFCCLWLMCAVSAIAAPAVNPVCKKGLERLVILSNEPQIANSDLQESLVIADSLLAKGCTVYDVDRFGKVYAGASLNYLMGRICLLHGGQEGIAAYLAYRQKNGSTEDDELDAGLEALFAHDTDLFLATAFTDTANIEKLYEALAWGFLYNVWAQQRKQVTADNYKALFYARYPMLKEVAPAGAIHTACVLKAIRAAVE